MKWIQVGGVSSLALISQLNRGCPHGGAIRRRLDFSEVVLMYVESGGSRPGVGGEVGWSLLVVGARVGVFAM